MFEYLLTLMGISQSANQSAQDRYMRASELLATTRTNILRTSIKLDFEIQRIKGICAQFGVPEEIALQSLFTMRRQCDQLTDQHDQSRSLLERKGASRQTLSQLENWASTCALMPEHVDLGAQQIERTIRQSH